MNIDLRLGDCLELMKDLPDASVDAVITSPPYWNQKAYSFWETYQLYLESVSLWVNEIARIMKSGRHCFWVIPDKLPFPPKVNGTDERLYMPVYADTETRASQSGLICEFPIIWKKPHGTQKMFGSYPYPPTIIHTPMTERICVWRKGGKADLSRKSRDSVISKESWVSWAQDLWEISPETKSDHPAPYPLDIPKRIITLWTFVGDTILDPFMGSGTTGVACVELNRNFIGMEILPEYFAIAQKRIADAQKQRALL
jgi:DNA modification methylase